MPTASAGRGKGGSGSSGSGPDGRAEQLVELAKARFPKRAKHPVLETLCRAAARGEVADYSSAKKDDNDPAQAGQWGAERVVDAEHIRWLCTDPEAAPLVSYRGVQVGGGRIDGTLDLDFADVAFPLRFDDSAFTGEIELRHATLPALYLRGTHVNSISADGMNVKGGVFLRGGFKAIGEVRLLGATIGGNLDCSDGKFNNADGPALSADGMNVKGAVFLKGGFKATGEVRLLGATIGGDLECSDGQFNNPDGNALSADGVNVRGSVFFSGDFKATGEVRLLGATIGGNLDCSGGEFNNADEHALFADSMNVKGSVLLRGSFQADGSVSLIGASIGTYFQWLGLLSSEKAILDLRSAKVGTLWVDPESWPKKGNLSLHGLTYDVLHEDSQPAVRKRIEWLRLQADKPFLAQPYQQLAAVLRTQGRSRDATGLLYAMEEDRGRFAEMSWLRKLVWYRFFGPIIGHGYILWHPALFCVILIALGAGLFGYGERTGSMIMAAAPPPGNATPTLHRVMYSLDVFIPLIDLHQVKYWVPKPGWLRGWFWFQILAGWTLTTLLVVGMTRVVRH